MKILGLTKLTLVDYPGKVACTVFTGGCNLRCPFCHNPDLVYGKGEPFSEEYILDFLKGRKNKLDGVCISGGEPLANPDISGFAEKIKSLGFKVKIDTNGTYPERLSQLIDCGIADYVAMDIKNSPQKYSKTAGVPNVDIESIKKSARLLMRANVDCEFRTTALKTYHTVDDFTEIGKWLEGADKYFIQPFVNNGDLICNSSENLRGFDKPELERIVNLLKPYFKFVGLRGV